MLLFNRNSLLVKLLKNLICYTHSPNVEEEAEAVDAPKGIPGYWAQCLVNHPAVEDICTHEGEVSHQRFDDR